MSKAEDLAKELFPDWEMTGVPTVDGQEGSMVRIQRVAYIKGYHQAEKDLELSWEDVELIYNICSEIFLDYEVTRTNMQKIWKEALKRFKEQRT